MSSVHGAQDPTPDGSPDPTPDLTPDPIADPIDPSTGNAATESAAAPLAAAVAPAGAPAPQAAAAPASAPSASGLGRASALLASGTLVSRLLGFIKAIVLAATIGQVSSEAGNAFGVANQLPNNVYALIAGGVLSAVLVPQIVRAGLHDDGGTRFINKIVTLGVTAFIGITVIVTLAAPLLIALYTRSSESGRGFSPEGIALATAFAYWCLPQVLFYAIYSLLGEVLNARKAFGAFTWAPVLNNVVAIAGLIAFTSLFGGSDTNRFVDTWDASRITLLAGTATLGVVAQALVLGLFWKRAGLTYRPDFRWRGVGLGRTGRAASWTFGMILVTQLAGIVQTRVASTAADQGASVLTLSSSWLIFMLPHSVIAVSIATAYFTRMSSHAASGNLAGVRDDVSASLRSISLLITFSAVTLLVVAFPFARIFEPRFENAVAMGFVIFAFVIGLVPFSSVFVMQRVFYSLEDTRTPFFIETVKSGVFVVLALVCSALPVQFVGVGIALATTVACLVQFVITFVVLRRKLGGIGGALLARRQLQYLIAAAVSGVIGVSILFTLGGNVADGFAQSGLVPAIVSIVIIAAGMGVVYLAVLFLMRVPELTAALDTVTSRFRRRR